ncbi:hydrogenobyrinic acid a,c-diamide synthase (glutamine-hydrolysing) /cobyrinate a,c-diamide synthase [Malonomonas rubra DSM 5091]|uniref:Cobyrinate a,c-diamide synthase n=1 Tax=Malonomonas rubra DSM 5091 TaxID=1122189 RepID=A0A1M6GLU4_MALRU|nr:cobyrinate a,c-diamide synthase [Malonomonas rubra]SHJ10846.1 hydrogenobyrinic acid a,c-diamide synthase (glutamine-hydrolysing) /cobyrinate a,c-diamide synthase [Malonomonas rubra DSM 5091]
MIPGLLIAAPSSGSGKTSLTLGLMAALRRSGATVAPFKVGPDYIDPGHHAAVCGRPSNNLDSWFCSREQVRATFATGCEGADIAIVEGVMGLFDGVSGADEEGSSAQIAKWLGLPVLLVVDARSQARSFAAVVKGFIEFDSQLNVAGVIANRVGSERHAQMLREAVESTPGLPPLLGCLPRQEDIALPERHLGLVTAEDLSGDHGEKLADWVQKHLDLDQMQKLASSSVDLKPPVSRPAGEKTLRIGIARDRAFCFYYPENLRLLEQAGAELVPFSPLIDAGLPENLAGLYLGGGYPELHAEALEKNESLRRQIAEQAAGGLPIYAECGGFMYLCAAIDSQQMCGVFPAQAKMLSRRRALGYRQVELFADTLLGPAGTQARGHEFHYSDVEMPESVERCYRLSRRGGIELGVEGYRIHNVLGSYVHLHFGSNPQVAENMVKFFSSNK